MDITAQPQPSNTSSSVDPGLFAMWMHMLPHVRAALRRSGNTHSEAAVFKMICEHQVQFWCSGTSFVVTEIVDYPLKRVLRIALAGGDLDDILTNFHDQVLGWGREQSCVEAEFNGRLGWHKRLSSRWKQQSETCVFDLREG